MTRTRRTGVASLTYPGLIYAAGLLACNGCAPPTRAAKLPEVTQAAPESNHTETLFAASDGLKLYRQSWKPSRAPRAALVIQHGLKSHGGDYAAFARAMTARGFAVYAADMRGHGRSAGQRATLDDFDQLVRDLRQTVTLARRELPQPKPVFLMGHSVGGALSALYAEQHQSDLNGLILLAPALRVDRTAVEAAATPFFGTLLPNAPLVDIPNAWFSRDPARVTAMDNSDLVYQPAGPARTGGALLEALEYVWAHPQTIQLPLLALHGTADKATDPRGSVEFVGRAGSADKQLLLYRGLYHDLLHEPERAQVTGDLRDWLERHVSP
ncbi:MAG: lysophospholipase [Polyangiaceae bacterium]